MLAIGSAGHAMQIATGYEAHRQRSSGPNLPNLLIA
jgi:hypothetical protein